MNPEAATWRGYARAALNAAVAGGAVAVSVFALYRLPDLAALFTIALLFGLVGPFLIVLRGHNFGAPGHERLPRQGIPLWPFILFPLIPFYLVALLVVRVMRDRDPEPRLWLIILGILLPPIGLLLVAAQDRARPISWGAGFGVVGLALAALFMEWAFSSNSYFFFAGGMSLVFGWAAFTLRYFHAAERASFTILAILLLAFWYASPAGALDFIIGDLEGGPELFFLSGLVMVACGTFLIVYNADILLPPIATLGARFGRIVPAVKTAVAYPLMARMRTGMTIMMIGLITFSLVMFSTVNDNFGNIFLSDDAKGGFDTIVFVNSNNRTDDLVGTLEELGVDTSPIVAVSEQRIASAGETEIFVDAPDSTDPPVPGRVGTYSVIGVDEAFFGANEFELKRRAAGYASDEEVWSAVATDPTLAVIPGTSPARAENSPSSTCSSSMRLSWRKASSRSRSASMLPARTSTPASPSSARWTIPPMSSGRASLCSAKPSSLPSPTPEPSASSSRLPTASTRKPSPSRSSPAFPRPPRSRSRSCSTTSARPRRAFSCCSRASWGWASSSASPPSA